jgi:CheY-like chemotaxis protein
MPGGGRLSIETCDTTLSAEDTTGDRSAPPPGAYAVVVVKDTGSGMDQATLQRAFEPFFTTKAVGEGSGLGLSVVHGIVNQTGGYIRVDSEPGKGATFELYFPLASAGRTAGAAAASDPVPAGAGRVALVVEDDALVRSMAVRGLLEAGYTTLEAADGRAALEMVRSHNGRLDVVITDIGMPEFDGFELAGRLHAERPDLPVVFMSGYGDTDPVGPFLQKPFAPDALVRMLAEVLASSPR